MSYQTVFKRYELKYMLTPLQKERIPEAMSTYMRLDSYGRTAIRNFITPETPFATRHFTVFFDKKGTAVRLFGLGEYPRKFMRV